MRRIRDEGNASASLLMVETKREPGAGIRGKDRLFAGAGRIVGVRQGADFSKGRVASARIRTLVIRVARLAGYQGGSRLATHTRDVIPNATAGPPAHRHPGLDPGIDRGYGAFVMT